MKSGSDLSQSIKYETEVSDSRDSRKPFLVHVSCLLNETTANVVICKARPQPPHLKARHSQCYKGNEVKICSGFGGYMQGFGRFRGCS